MVLSILGSQSYLGCCYQKVEPSLFFSPGSVSLGQSILFGLLLSEGKTFSFFFTWLCLSWVVSPIWLLLPEGRTFVFFSYLILSLLGIQSYLGCCYLKAEPFLFFHLILSLLGSQSYLGCYLKAEPFLFFYLVFSLLSGRSYFDQSYLLYISECTTKI